MFTAQLLATYEAYSAATWVVVFLTLVAAGVIKGTIGFGLPLSAISVLSNVIDLHLALAMMTLPILTSSLSIGLEGGQFFATIRKFWLVVVALGAGIFIGSWFLTGIDGRVLMLLVGVTIILFTLAEQWNSGQGFTIPQSHMQPVGMAAGVVGGLMGGLSTAYGPLLVLYLTALRLPKEVHIATIGVILFFGSIFLVLAFSSVRILTLHTAAISTLAVFPVFIGLGLGRRIRGRVNQVLFRRMTLVALLILALNLLRRALF